MQHGCADGIFAARYRRVRTPAGASFSREAETPGTLKCRNPPPAVRREAGSTIWLGRIYTDLGNQKLQSDIPSFSHRAKIFKPVSAGVGVVRLKSTVSGRVLLHL